MGSGHTGRHFTVAVFVVWEGKVLLHHHRKLGMWLPPGGHIDICVPRYTHLRHRRLGEAKGDLAKLQEAFHADARMFGSLAGERFDVPIEELFKLAESDPADTGNYRSRVLSVQQEGMTR